MSGTDYYKFFFGDERGKTFVNAFLDKENNFNPKVIQNDVIQLAIMTGRYRSSADNNFQGFKREDTDIQNMDKNGNIETIIVKDNDIHPEFVFFVQQMANRMKQIDQFSDNGTKLQLVVSDLRSFFVKNEQTIKPNIARSLSGQGSISSVDLNTIIDYVDKLNIPVDLIKKGNDSNELKNKIKKDLTFEFDADYYTPGMKACAQSHLLIWKHVIENNIPYAFILEVDARFDKNWIEN